MFISHRPSGENINRTSNVYWVITGPTAAGKTAALLQQATTRPMVAISADSRQVYRHMNIGTGTPTTNETTLLSHKVIDVIAPLDEFNAHCFLLHAAQALRQIQQSNLEPWVVGGTGLYIRALVQNLRLGGPPRPRLRAAIEQMLEETNSQEVAQRFKVSTSDDCNSVRVTRAIENTCNECSEPVEIYQLAGLSEEDCLADTPKENQQDYQDATAELARWHCGGIVVIDPGKEDLLTKIRLRVNGMFKGGLVEEVKLLRELGYGAAKVVTEGIGYREAGEVLDGRMRTDEAIDRTVIRTRQYAKRQRTYFKNMGWDVIHPENFEEWYLVRNSGTTS